MDYEAFLNKKPLYYDEIDYTRFPRIFNLVKLHLNLPPIIHIVGTNGKGSTGRFLAQILAGAGKKVGHYTSPHIFDFSERFYSSFEEIDKFRLNLAHNRLLEIFSLLNNTSEIVESLSYFEWATLMAGVIFEGYDFLILEAGMGGEYDATNAFDKSLSIFTPIGLDHIDMLGSTIEEIAKTKLNSMQNQALISSEFACMELANQIAKQKSVRLIKQSDIYAKEIQNYAIKFNLPEFLRANLSLAVNAANILNIENLAQIISNLGALTLRGRCEKIKPNLIIDVGHNAHAAKAIAQNLQNIGWREINLIYNAFDDKDIFGVLLSLKPFIGKIHIYNYKSYSRKLATHKITQIAKDLGITCCEFTNLDENEKYLVFGSFMLVENFIKEEIER
ncbi:Mur ligase family protein [Campylobacter devanensis]|uniref:Mur ligase family protein n=1 Tax=Campylobacter devanensis TaxID=3161138 RepID=UPI000A351E1F|nr:Mur ligase family protein [Campylobacter sp. P0087]